MVATGLEAAAAAASLIALTNLILTKVVPALGETRHVDDGIRKLYREIDGFEKILSSILAFLKSGINLQHRTREEQQHVRSMKDHMAVCEKTATELLQKLPEVADEDGNLLEQGVRQIKQLARSGTVSRLLHDIADSKVTLDLWLHLLLLEMTRNSEITEDKNRVTVQNNLDSLGTKIDSLEAELRLRRQRLLRDESAEVLEDLVSRNGEACLQSARTVHRAYTAEYRPTARSVAQRRGSGVRIPEWEEQVRRDSESNPPPPESTPASIGGSDGKLKIEFDEGYTSDDVGQAGVHEGTEVIPLDVLTSVVSDHINEAQKCRRVKKYDEAAMHQWKAIHYSEQKAQAPYSVEFRDSQIMKLTLADLYLECRKYANAVTILTKLLKEGRTDASQCAALNGRLGAAYLQQGKLQAAASHANDANNWKESNLDKEDPSLVESLTLLSTIYDKMGKSMLSRGFALKAMHHRILIKGQLNAEIENAFQGERSEEDQTLTQTLKDILERVDDVDGSRGVLALQTFHHAVAFNRLEVTTFLWQYSATVRESIDVLNEVGMAPLISATRFGHEDMVRFLLVKGANVNARFDDADIRGESALLIAAEKQLKGIIELLLDHGADPLQSNSLGRNALHRAIGPPADAEDMVRKEIIQLLLRRNTSALLQARCGATLSLSTLSGLVVKHISEVEDRERRLTSVRAKREYRRLCPDGECLSARKTHILVVTAFSLKVSHFLLFIFKHISYLSPLSTLSPIPNPIGCSGRSHAGSSGARACHESTTLFSES